MSESRPSEIRPASEDESRGEDSPESSPVPSIEAGSQGEQTVPQESIWRPNMLITLGLFIQLIGRGLLHTPELIIKDFTLEENDLTEDQFLRSTWMITSCLMKPKCQLSVHEHHNHEHGDHEDEEEEHKNDNHKDEEEEEHEHEHGNHENEEEEHEHEHGNHEDEEEEGHEHEHGNHENEEEEHKNDNHKDEEEEEHEHEHDNHEDHTGEVEGHDQHENERGRLESQGHGHDSHDHDDHDNDDDDDDDDILNAKVVALVVLFVEAVLGSIVPLCVGTQQKFKNILSVINCFSGGVLLATGVIHLVPHVIEYEEETNGIGDYHLGLVVVVIGFALVFYVEHVFFDVHSHSDLSEEVLSSSNPQEIKQKQPSRLSVLKHTLILLAATSVHSVLEALVLGFQDDSYDVWILFASIAGHKGVTAMALSSRLQKSKATLTESIILTGLFSLTAPISILIGTALSDVPSLANLILTGLSTGTFLYIGAYEIINEEFQGHAVSPSDLNDKDAFHSKTARHIKFLGIFLGIVVIALVALTPHHSHDHDHGH